MSHLKKLVLKLDLRDDRQKSKAMIVVSSFEGIYSISSDEEDKNKITITGSFDATDIVGRLRKKWHTEMISFGLASEPEKEEPEKEGDSKNKDENGVIDACMAYHPSMSTPYHYNVHTIEENPNMCVIC